MKTVKKVLIVLGVIVVVWIAICILAAVATPQFTEAGYVAKASTVWSELKTMRSQIELYKTHHNGNLPGLLGTATFKQAMTQSTDIWGNPGTDYGPYVQKIPTNPFNGLDTVDVSAMSVIGDDSHGWNFHPITGTFNADDSAEHER